MNNRTAAVTMMALLGLAPSLRADPIKPVTKAHTQATTQHQMKNNSPAELQREAKVSMEKARSIALSRTPGTITDGELEREHRQLIYSFDIKTTKPGITEVQVDAVSGKVTSVKHESPKHEAAEKKQEAKEAKH